MAAFHPIRRHFGELTIPRLRAGTLQIPSGHKSDRIRVIVTLKPAPLSPLERHLTRDGLRLLTLWQVTWFLHWFYFSNAVPPRGDVGPSFGSPDGKVNQARADGITQHVAQDG